jgi:hypothetical protein
LPSLARGESGRETRRKVARQQFATISAALHMARRPRGELHLKASARSTKRCAALCACANSAARQDSQPNSQESGAIAVQDDQNSSARCAGSSTSHLTNVKRRRPAPSANNGIHRVRMADFAQRMRCQQVFEFAFSATQLSIANSSPLYGRKALSHRFTFTNRLAHDISFMIRPNVRIMEPTA